MTTDEKLEKLAQAVLRLIDVMGDDPDDAADIEAFTNQVILREIREDITAIFKDR